MKYPKKLAKRADEILAARRWDAERRQAHTLALLHEQHPEVEAARRSLASLYAKRGTAAIFEPDTLEGIDAQISAGREQLQALMAAAGITEADLEPSYTCPACMDRGMANGQTCTCRQTILNQLVYEQLCDVSPARECSFDKHCTAAWCLKPRRRPGSAPRATARWERGARRRGRRATWPPKPSPSCAWPSTE